MPNLRTSCFKLLLFALAASVAPSAAQAQGIDLSNTQVHGFATQSFLYTTRNNWATTNSSDGSPAWTEAVVNLTAQPESKLRIGVQARYFLLGDYGNKISLDWAQADYKVSELLGFRVGKVKTPVGLFNEIQDIDPAYLWVLLPQSIYPLPSRNANLAHYGGVLYGKLPLGESMGKFEYRAFGGQRVVAADDGYLQSTRDTGATVPNGVSGPTFGGTFRWSPPSTGFLLGASETAGGVSGQVNQGPYLGQVRTTKFRQTYYFLRYERSRFLLAGEYNRLQITSDFNLGGVLLLQKALDQHDFYAMATYRPTGKLSTGLYYSSVIDTGTPTSSARYQKDWALSARYDFSPSLYAKFEQHFIDGTQINYSTLDNPNLQPNTRMTLLKLGISF